MMGDPEWARWEIFGDGLLRGANSDVLKTRLNEWTRGWTVDALFRAGQKRRICFAPVNSMADLHRQEQLRSRDFFVEVTHPRAGTLAQPGPPYRLREAWWKIRRPAPCLGEHTEEVLAQAAAAARELASAGTGGPASGRSAGLPLEGVRVADFTWVWAGPFGAMHLAHLGAEVIKIESHARPDLGRRLPIYPPDVEPGLNRSGYFNQWNQGKRSVLLNLAKPEAANIARRIVARCDVMVENFATGVIEQLGLGYEEVRKLRPDIIFASISGYGHSGPQKDYIGYGPATVPLAGLASLTGYPDGGPQEVGLSYGDPTSGIHAAVAICAALAARRRTGRGQYIDVSLWEATAALVAEGWMEHAMNGTQPARAGNRDPWMAPHDCFRCAGEDQWVTIACGSDREWQALCRAMGTPAIATDPRFATAAGRKANEDDLEALIAAWTEPRDKWEVTRTLQAAGVAAFPSMSSKDLEGDAHLRERGFFSRLPHPEVGVRAHAGIPWRLTNGPNGVRSPAPLLGQDTDSVMRELLGYSEAEIASLKEGQVLY